MVAAREARVILKTDAEVEIMRRAGRVVGETLQELAEMVRPGVDVQDLNTYVVPTNLLEVVQILVGVLTE